MSILWYKYRSIALYKIGFLLSKIFGIRIPPFPSTCALIKKDGKVLVIDLNYEKGYSIPGGGIEVGENAEDAMIREVYEETGLKVTGYTYEGSYFGVSHGMNFFSTMFSADVQGKLKGSKEGTPKWVPLKEAYENCAYEDVKKFLKEQLKKDDKSL